MKKLLIGIAAAALVAVIAILAISPNHTSQEGTGETARSCETASQKFINFEAGTAATPIQADDITDGDGKRIDFSEYRGKGVVLNFWATWCAPCVREMPSLMTLQRKLNGSNIVVLPISEDLDGAAKVKEFYRAHSLTDFPVIMDPGGELVRRVKVHGLPTTLLINPAGVEKGRIVGPLEWDTAEVVNLVRSCVK